MISMYQFCHMTIMVLSYAETLFRQGGFIDHNPHDDQFDDHHDDVHHAGNHCLFAYNVHDPDDLS